MYLGEPLLPNPTARARADKREPKMARGDSPRPHSRYSLYGPHQFRFSLLEGCAVELR
jgi:hypothetical protein